MNADCLFACSTVNENPIAALPTAWKTIASAIVVEALEADYWKPIQAGDLDNSDSHKVMSKVESRKSKGHPNAYALNTPASPHLAAQLDGITIGLKQIKEPKTDNHLVIEGAGGVLVPLNDKDTIVDLIAKLDVEVILVSNYYLGSINHTLLSIACLKAHNITIKGIVFNGEKNEASKAIILSKTGLSCLLEIKQEEKWDAFLVNQYAVKLFDNWI